MEYERTITRKTAKNAIQETRFRLLSAWGTICDVLEHCEKNPEALPDPLVIKLREARAKLDAANFGYLSEAEDYLNYGRTKYIYK